MADKQMTAYEIVRALLKGDVQELKKVYDDYEELLEVDQEYVVQEVGKRLDRFTEIERKTNGKAE